VFLRSKWVKGNEYLYLVENRWEGGRCVQSTVHYFGRRDRIDPAVVRQIVEHYRGIRHLSSSDIATLERKGRGEWTEEDDYRAERREAARRTAREAHPRA
jgi:hypothetical protein